MSLELGRALNGLTLEDLNQRPSSETTSMGWLAWHLARCQDRAVADLMGEDQLWIRDKWFAKFNRPEDPQDLGVYVSLEEVAAFKSPEAEILLGYQQAVFNRAKDYIGSLSEAGLDREIDNPRSPTVWARLLGIVNDSSQHLGQIAYVRGLLKGKGWWEASR